MGLISNVFSDYTKRNKNRIKTMVNKVNSFSSWADSFDSPSSKVLHTLGDNYVINDSSKMSDFLVITEEFRERLRNGETIDDIKVEALSVVRQAIKRTLGMYPYDTQIEAALAMSENVIAEMKTGEGKTLVQILVAYLNLLEATKDIDKSKWKSVHIMTSNDALAKRDADNNRKVFELLGFSCGFVPSRKSTKGYNKDEFNLYKKKKRESYLCDVVYATASTIAFDYLDDNTIYNNDDRIINRDFGYAIVDEADDLLIDQAINPLKLSGSIDANNSEYERVLLEREKLNTYLYSWVTKYLYERNKIGLQGKVYDQYFPNKYNNIDSDYIYFLDTNEVVFPERIINELYNGLENNKDRESIYNLRYSALMDAIRAKHTFIKDKQYKVDVNNNIGKIVLIDQNTGRRKTSNKYTGGLQEAIEAKEEYFASKNNYKYHIERTRANITKAMCTYPDFLSLYNGNVCGMTGTSDIDEFISLYGLETYEVESRKKNIRIDEEDRVYATKSQKYNAIINEILKAREKMQPILIGTTSDRESEIISSLLNRYNIPHNLLNSNHEEEENEIIKNAGLLGMVSVCTNMAGRGTDIKLGPGVSEVGGLYVIGVSKNKSKRIDYQLRGRAARQGDPGKTVFFSSLEDEMVKMYYPNSSLNMIIKSMKNNDGPIKNKTIINLVNKAQINKEGTDKLNRSISEKYNKVFTEHKKIIYRIRKSLLEKDEKIFLKNILKIVKTYNNVITQNFDLEDINNYLGHLVNVNDCYDDNKLKFCDNLNKAICKRLDQNLKGLKINGVNNYINKIRNKLLNTIDMYWIDHIEVLSDIEKKNNISLSEDPISKYEYEANKDFSLKLLPSIMNEIITYSCNPDLEFSSYIIKETKNKDELKISI